MSADQGALLINAVTLLVIIATAVAGLIQLRHLRAQNTLNAELAILRDWSDPQFREWRFYIAGELQAKLKDPVFLAEYDASEVDRSRHPELYACDWLEQIGSYLKYGLLDADVLLDVTSTSINRLWNQLAPAIEQMRVTRGDSLYENFEYWAAKGRLWAKAHPGGAYPRNMPRMRDLKGVGTGAGTIFRPAIFGDTRVNQHSANCRRTWRRQSLIVSTLSNSSRTSNLCSCRNARRGIGKILAIFAVPIGIQTHHRI